MRDRGSMKIVLALVLSLAGAASAAAQGVVKLPIVAEITGGGASVGAMWRDAVNLTVEDINRKGGILGMRLETSVQDTQTDPPTSVAVMRRVLNDKPFAVLGRCTTRAPWPTWTSRARPASRSSPARSR